MSQLSDDELMVELKERFDRTKQAVYDLKMVTKKLEEVNRKLEESERMKSNFISHMKNEINNPLTSIMGLAEQLSINPNIAPEMVATIGKTLHAEAFGLDFQLRNIFQAADLESGDTRLQVSLVDVGSLINHTVRSFVHQIEAKQIQVTVTCGHAGELRFKTDAEKLQMVISNLVCNAIEFNREQGTVEVTARLIEGDLSITVADSGIGIPREKVGQIFDRFFQIESGITKSHRGHGLGLSITKALVDIMEGSISVDCNSHPGCSFTVSIPEVETDIAADAFSVDGNEFFFDDGSMESF